MTLSKKNNKREKKKNGGDELLKDNMLDPIEDDVDAVLEDVEDDDDFISQVKEFEKKHNKAKLVSILSLLGNPKVKTLASVKPDLVQKEFEKLSELLDLKGIIVHFQNNYPVREKYRFITEEILNQFVEISDTNGHISFIYEDFHPEAADDEEEEF